MSKIFKLFYLFKEMKEVLTAYKAQEFIKPYIGIPKSQIVKKIEEVSLPTPIVLKIVSKKALHKTEVNGVKIVKNKDELNSEFQELIKTAKRKNLPLEGILVQEFISGQELIIGIKKDPAFNHVIVFGLGGIFTETLKDISIRKCPINSHDADEMFSEIKGREILQGVRGKKLNLLLLKETLINISKIPLKYKNISELDINPFILNEKTGKAADVRIVFEEK